MDALVKIPELTLKSTLKSHVLFELVLDKLVQEIKKLPNLQSFKLNNEMASLVCTLIENTVKKKDKVDKKKLAVQVLTLVFTLTPAEQIIISNQIEYLLENKLIKKIKKAITTRAYRKVKHVLFKKKR
jgi:hypothetical protein